MKETTKTIALSVASETVAVEGELPLRVSIVLASPLEDGIVCSFEVVFLIAICFSFVL